MASVRFSRVVAVAGEPTPHIFWMRPEKDAEFQRALKGNRVMTVAPRARGKADIGHVGFKAKAADHGQVLVFPKSLKRFETAEVVGVKFELVKEPSTVAAKTELKRISPRTKRRPPSNRPQRPLATQEMRATSVAEAPATPTRTSAAPRPPPMRARAKTESREDQSPDYHALAKEVHAALEELREGKTLAAYQRLKRALG